jgi:hypothetical protein
LGRSVTDVVFLFPQLHDFIRRDGIALDVEMLVMESFYRNGLQDIGDPSTNNSGISSSISG